MTDLLRVEDAIRQIHAELTPLPAEAVPLSAALGRVLAEDVIADVSLPPFANSSMDGFAVRAEDVVGATAQTPVRLALVMDIPAGAAPERELGPGQAARIMTGAPLPEGADAVVPVEETDGTWDAGQKAPLPPAVSVFRGVRAGANVRPVGEDIQAGQAVIEAGTVLRPAEIGVLASLGQAQVTVIRQPRVAILATGDELVDADEPLTPGKIRNSNSYVLAALVAEHGGLPIPIPAARDTLDDTRRRFHEALSHEPDLILTSAGVSVGAHDVVRTVLEELGRVHLWRVNLRPGKPLAFGRLRGVPFFGLPGNPVSTMVTFDVLVRPALLRLAGRPDTLPIVEAALGEDVRSDGRRTYLRVKLRREGGAWIATSTGTQSSGAQMSMVLADGLLILPEGVTEAKAGERYPVRLLRGWEAFLG